MKNFILSIYRRFSSVIRENKTPLVIAAVTAGFRLIYLATVSHDPFFHYLKHIPDAYYFNNWAQQIVADGDWLGGKEVFFIGPLYAYFLALIYVVFGPTLTAVRIVHVALDVGTAFFIYGFANGVFNRRAAVVAGLVWAFYLPAVFKASFILPVALDIFLVAAAFYFLARADKGPWWNNAVAGTLFGLLALDRTNAVICLAGFAVVWLIFLNRHGWVKPIAFLVACALPLAAVTVRNYAVAHDWVFVSSQGGVNFFIGNSENAHGVYWNIGEMGQGRPEELNRNLAVTIAMGATGKREIKSSEVSRWWFQQGFDWLRKNPRRALRLYWDKIRLATNDYEVALNVDFYFMKFITPLHLLPLPYFAFIFSFGILGMSLPAERPSVARVLAKIFIVLYALSIVTFFISARYRLPIVPALICFGAAGAVRWYDTWRSWRLKRAVTYTAIVVALGTFSLWPPLDIKRDSAFGQSFFRYGKYYFDEGDYDKAITYLHRAMMRSPEIIGTYVFLGIAYEQKGQRDTSLEMFRRAVALAPDNPEANFNYGLSLARNGFLAEAATFLTRTTELSPQYLQAWYQLAEVSIALGDLGRAEFALRRATELSPQDAHLLVRFSQVLMENGNYAEGLDYAGRALALNPRQPGANFILGVWYYQTRDYLKAAHYLEKEAAVDASQPRTFLLLAAARLHMGDVARADESYRRYLSLGGQRDYELEKGLGRAGRIK